MTSKTFKSGDRFRPRGGYEVFHSTAHAHGVREMYFEESRFSECGSCSAGALYRLESPCVPMQTATSALFALATC